MTRLAIGDHTICVACGEPADVIMISVGGIPLPVVACSMYATHSYGLLSAEIPYLILRLN